MQQHRPHIQGLLETLLSCCLVLSAVCAVLLVPPAAGIAMNAVLLTFSTAASLLFAVKTRIIQVTDRFADTVRTGAACAAAPAAHARRPGTACEDISTTQLGLAADEHSAQGQATSHHGWAEVQACAFSYCSTACVFCCVLRVLQVRALTGGYLVAIMLVFLGSLVGLKLPGLFSGGKQGQSRV